MESQSRIFKVVVQFQEKDEVFYTRIKCLNGIPGSLTKIISSRYPSLTSLVKRCYVKDKLGAEFCIINADDLSVFLDGEDLFENVVQVEINGVNRDTELASPAKKVRIAEQAAQPPQEDAQNKPVHTNVICDCCDETIVGYRYKCSECFNFDLCMTCEGKMRHREHIMIRIPEPSRSAYSPCRFMKLNRGAPATETAQPCDEKSRRHHHKRHHHRRHGARPNTMFDGLFRQFDPEGLVSDPDTDSATQQQQQGGQAQSGNAAAGGPTPAQPPYDFQTLVKAVECVAGNVAKFLEPLGMAIDMDYGTPTTQCPPTEKPTTSTENATQPPTKPKTPEPMDVVADDSSDKSPVNNNEPIPSTSTVSAPEPFIVDIVEDESTNQSSIIEPTTGHRSSPASNHSDDAEWLVISAEGLPDSPQKEATPTKDQPIAVAVTAAAVETSATASTSAQTHIGYDELARKLQKDIEEQLKISSSTTSTQTNVPVIYHPAPHIHMSIQRMIDMGFSNDGDSLINLMVCCNGDIRRALDMLLHKK